MRVLLDRCLRLLTLLAIAGQLSAILETRALAQLTSGDIVVPEFFEELYRIQPSGGSATDILNSPIFESVLGDHLAVANADTAYLTSFDELYKFDFSSGMISLVSQLTFVPREITMTNDGDLIALHADEVVRVDASTGNETGIYTETFFGPSDAVVDAAGSIYLTEFFDGLGVLSPAGSFTKIGNFDTNQFNHLDLGPDGQIYLSTTSGSSFYRVNPSTGAGLELDSDVFTFIDDLQVDATGDIIFSGEVDQKSGVFRFVPSTKQLTTIVDDTSVNGGFFNPLDIAIFNDAQEYASADLNESGAVDGADLALIMNSYSTGTSGDVDRDGDTDGSDLLSWQRQFTVVSGLQPIPEPTTAALLLGLCGLSIAAVPRRRLRYSQ